MTSAKKTAAQLDAEIAEALSAGGGHPKTTHATRRRKLPDRYEILETVDGDWMILIDGIQTGFKRDRSGTGAGDTYPTHEAAYEAALKLATGKKRVKQIVDEEMTTTSVSNERRTDTPVQLLPGYAKALARAKELLSSPAAKRGEFGWAGAAGRAVATMYGIHGAGDEGFGGDVRRIYKAISEDLRR